MSRPTSAMPRGFAAALAVTAWATAAQVPAEASAHPSARFLIDRRGAGGAGLASEAVPVSFAQALEGKTESQDVKREVRVVQKDKNVDMDVDKKDVLVHQNFERDKDHEHGSLKDSDSETDGGGDSTGKKKDNVDDVTVDSSQEQHEESVDEKSVDDDEEQELEKFVQSVKESSDIQKATASSKLKGNSAAKKEQETLEFIGRMARHLFRKGKTQEFIGRMAKHMLRKGVEQKTKEFIGCMATHMYRTGEEELGKEIVELTKDVCAELTGQALAKEQETQEFIDRMATHMYRTGEEELGKEIVELTKDVCAELTGQALAKEQETQEFIDRMATHMYRTGEEALGKEIVELATDVCAELTDQAVAKVDALEKFVQSSEIQKATAFSKLNGNSAAKKEQETREFIGRMARHMFRKGVEEFPFLDLLRMLWRNFWLLDTSECGETIP